MASYEVEHNVDLSAPPPKSRRPDMSTFTAAFAQLDPTNPTQNPHSQPTPVAVRSAFDLAATGLSTLLPHAVNASHSAFLTSLITSLHETGDSGSPEALENGVSQEFLDGLERVDRRRLGKEEVCPVCGEVFLEDKYCLVVRLPCDERHRFDLECVGPWLRLKGTCPLDRKMVAKKKEVVVVKDEEEEDYDDMIA